MGGKTQYEFFKTVSNHRNLFSVVHTVASKRGAGAQEAEKEQSQSCQGSVTSLARRRPHPLSSPFSPDRSESDKQSQSVPASVALPFAQLPLLPRVPTAEVVAKANTAAASPKISTLISSSSPEFELQEACPLLTPRPERAELASWGVKKELT